MMGRANLATIVRRELAAYFNSPIAYIFIVVFALLTASLFMAQFFLVNLAEMRIFFHFMPLVLCVFLPAVAMRLWAEDKRGNTFELLLTFPLKPAELVLGKFIASFIFYLVSLAATFTIPVMLMFLGRPDLGPIIGGYIGAAFLGALFLAIGIFVSGFFHDQIIAFVIAMLACFALFLLGTEFIASSIDSWLPGFGTFLRINLGMSRHFASFQKGVLDVRDIIYFLTGTGIFLILNGFWIEGRMRPKQTTIFSTAVGLSLLIFLLANWLISDITLGRFDLTEGKIYTVSPVTRKILGDLKAPVTVKYYVSPREKMPTGIKTLEQEVVDKLDEFRVASKGKLAYNVFHMEAANIMEGAPGSQGAEESLEQSLQRKGIQPFQVQSIEADEVGVRLIYSAISIAYKEKPEELLPRIIPGNVDELEYLIVSKIFRMTMEKQPEVAIVAPEKELALDPQMRALMQQMGQTLPSVEKIDEYRLVPLALEYEGYRTERVTLDEGGSGIPDGTDTLVVLQPKELTGAQRSEISRFLASGGSVFLAAQNYTFDYAPAGRGAIRIMPNAENPQVNPLLETWGLGIEDGILMDENEEILSVSGGMQLGPFQLSIPIKLPIHIRIDPDQMNPNVSITSRLPSILYLWGSALKINENKLKETGLKYQVLMNSTRASWLMSADAGPLSPAMMRRTAAHKQGPFPLGILVEGQFSHVPEAGSAAGFTPAPGKLILFGAAAPFQEQLIKNGGHLNFLLNSIDALSLSEALMEIRSKQPVNRSLKRLSAPGKVWWRFFSSLMLPLIIAVLGGFRILMRRREKNNYLKLIK